MMTMTQHRLSRLLTVASSVMNVPKSMAWLFIFLPALSYFIVTRLPASSKHRLIYGMDYGIPITATMDFIPITDIPERSDHNVTSINTVLYNKLLEIFQFSNVPTTGTTGSTGTNDFAPGNNSTNATKLNLRYPLQLIYEIPTKRVTAGNQTTSTGTWSSSTGSNRAMIRDIIYRYDSNIGRGYVLYTTSFDNRIWRFEIGSGLFPIGNTLFMDHACCRSQPHCWSHGENSTGIDGDGSTGDTGGIGWCGPLALEYVAADAATAASTGTGTSPTTAAQQVDSKVIIAEYGEARLVRLEEEYGARTPLLTHMPLLVNNGVPLTCTNNVIDATQQQQKQQQKQLQRLPNPDRMMYTSQGHLLLVVNDVVVDDDNDQNGECMYDTTTSDAGNISTNTTIASSAAIILLPNTLHTSPFTNLQQSRAAHYWDTAEQYNYSSLRSQQPYIFLNDPSKILWIGDIAISNDGRTLYGIAEIVRTSSADTIVPAPEEKSITSPTTSSIVIFQLPMKLDHDGIDDDDDDDDDRNKNESGHSTLKQQQEEIKILIDLSKYYESFNFTSRSNSTAQQQQQQPQHHRTSPSSVSLLISQRNILYVTVSDGILLIDPIIGHVIGQLCLSSSSTSSSVMTNNDRNSTENNHVGGIKNTHQSLSYPSAMTLGGDGYLYIAANGSKLYRIRTNDLPVVFVPKKTQQTKN